LEEPDFSGFGDMEITIVGLGLIGGSYAMAFRKLNPKKIWAIDIDRDILEQAENKGIIDGGFIETESVLKRSDLVILCVYPESTVQFIEANLDYFKPGAVLTDTAGIKEKLVDQIQGFIRDDLDFIGGHPLAGKECSGFAHASSDILRGANYLLTPTPKNNKANILLMEQMVNALGCREAICMSPAKHDEIIALTSQLPHLIATALINSSEYENTGNLVGGSFKDATRVAKMNVELWSELFLENKKNILTQIDQFLENICQLKTTLQEEDRAGLIQILKKGNQTREGF